jgi:CBS domain containing-hemolysin-like protein
MSMCCCCCVGANQEDGSIGFGAENREAIELPSPSLLLFFFVASSRTTSLVTSRSERAVIESIPGHPRKESLQRRLWLQVAAIEERTLLVSLGQFSRTSTSSKQCPLHFRGLWVLLLRLLLPLNWLPRVILVVVVVVVAFVVVLVLPLLVVVLVPRAVSNRTWTWVSFKFSKPSRVNSRSDDSTEAGRKSSR